MGLRGEGNGLVKRKRSRAVPPPAAAAAAVYVQRVSWIQSVLSAVSPTLWCEPSCSSCVCSAVLASDCMGLDHHAVARCLRAIACVWAITQSRGAV